ncbi:MAG: hypothetical protein IKE46_04405 [Selenomonadaceae bacterium]|nr:hypothetical protein [Selenomonadaceae bacterium]
MMLLKKFFAAIRSAASPAEEVAAPEFAPNEESAIGKFFQKLNALPCVNSAKSILQKLRERLCQKINERLFSDEKILALLEESLNFHLSRENELGAETSIEYALIDDYDAEDVESVESYEPGSTQGSLLATTSLYEMNEYVICFALNPIKAHAFKFWPWQAKKEIQDIAKHEAFHVRQYHYICQEGGMEAIDRLTEYMRTTPYNDNIFELGAYLYQWGDEVHDFAADFDPFIHPENYLQEDEESAA